MKGTIMDNMEYLAERFTAIGIAWSNLLNACKEGDTQTATHEKLFILGYIDWLMGDSIMTYDDKKKVEAEIQSVIEESKGRVQ